MVATIIFTAILVLLYWIVVMSPRHPEYLLIIPFAVTTNFFGFLPYAYLSQKGVFQQDDIVFALVLLIGVVFLFRKRLGTRKTAFYNNYKRLQVIFTLFLVAVFIISLVQYGDFVGSLKIFKRFIRYFSIIPFSFILMNLEKERMRSLFNLIEKITIILSFLYVANYGFGIPVFAVASYKEISFAGSELYRNFDALPIFSLFILARLLLRPRLTVGGIVSILAILASYFFVYTRSFAGAVILTLALAVFVWTRINRRSLQRTLSVGLAIVIFGLIVTSLFSPQLQYFMDRLRSAPGSSLMEAPTLLLRENIVLSRVQEVANHNPVTGLGFMGESLYGGQYQSLFVRRGDINGAVIIGDQSWGNFIGSIGFGGALLFLILYFYPILYLEKKGIFWKQHSDVYAALIALLSEIFIIAFFSTNLIDHIFLICFLMATIQYHINDYLNAAPRQS